MLLLLALQLAVGFGFADAAVACYPLEGVHLGKARFGHDQLHGFEDGFWLFFDCGLRGQVEHQDHFAADLGAGGEVGADFGCGAAEELFVELGELAGEDDGLRGRERGFDVGEGFEDAVRGFVENVGLRSSRECFELAAALACFGVQEAVKGK